MIQKLSKKEFPKELITLKITAHESEITDWEENKSQIFHQRDILLSRGKSKQFVMMTLVGKYPYFRDEIREIIEM
jgi:hypothetical protein